MRTSQFDYQLPAELIAQHAVERGESRLLAVPCAGGLEDRTFSELPALLEPGDLVVVNNTRVLPARLFGRRSGGGQSELLLVTPADAEVSTEAATEWICLGRPRKRMPPGSEIDLGQGIVGKVKDHLPPDRMLVRFSAAPSSFLETLGHVPLPPYIERPDSTGDHERYQTVYAEVPGAVAAPTAGLHFDEESLRALDARGVSLTKITLHVGPGTFRPVTADRIEDHPMESERYEIGEEAAAKIQATRAAGGRVVAIGTTVVRALEATALESDGRVVGRLGETRLFIRPGFEFQVVDRLVTNFHLPRSTLLMLVSAFAGRTRVLEVYEHAIARRYRFYSYGDAMLLDCCPDASR